MRVTVFDSGFVIFLESATTLLLVLNINSSAAHFVSSPERSIDALVLLGKAGAILILSRSSYIISLKDKVGLEKKKNSKKIKMRQNNFFVL